MPPESAGGAKKESPSLKFDKMLAAVDIWQGQLGVDLDLLEDARLGRVLLGCFAGAKVPEVCAWVAQMPDACTPRARSACALHLRGIYAASMMHVRCGPCTAYTYPS